MQDRGAVQTHLLLYGKAITLLAIGGLLSFSAPHRAEPGAVASPLNSSEAAPAAEILSSPQIEHMADPLKGDARPVAFHIDDAPRSFIDYATYLRDREAESTNTVRYLTQPGDTLQSLMRRFDVPIEEIRFPGEIVWAEDQLIDPELELLFPESSRQTTASRLLLPDSEIVYSPAAKDFDASAFADEYGGYLNVYREKVDGIWMSGPEVVARAAEHHSVNPKLLLAILEHRSGWLTNPALPPAHERRYPIWDGDPRWEGLYLQLTWTANELSEAYYGWRDGTFLELSLAENQVLPIAPSLNAGSAAIQHLLSRFDPESGWMNSPAGIGLLSTYRSLFGDPWTSETAIYSRDMSQPDLILPFPDTSPWIFTGGPHGAWGSKSAWAALDFAPKWDSYHHSSDKQVLAVADAVIARLHRGIIVLDLDGDGYEQTGWSILYLHVIASEGLALGDTVSQGQVIGRASTEGGVANGVHIHIARKYNGEWIKADGPLPFELSGWRVREGLNPYEGVLYREGCELLACPCDSEEILGQIDVGAGVGAVIPPTLTGCCPYAGRPVQSLVPESTALSNHRADLLR